MTIKFECQQKQQIEFDIGGTTRCRENDDCTVLFAGVVLPDTNNDMDIINDTKSSNPNMNKKTIWIVEPRRVAVRSAAHRMTSLLQEKDVGNTVECRSCYRWYTIE